MMADEKEKTTNTEADSTKVNLEDLEKFAGGGMGNVTINKTHDISEQMKDKA
jgi:hypothetical protein